MNDLKNSILFLLIFIFGIFGIAQIDFVEQNLLNFDPIFFILVSLAVLSALFLVQFTNITIYQFLIIWSVVYTVVRVVFWQRTLDLSIELVFLEFMLVDIFAGLAYDVGRQIGHVSQLLDKLTTITYPNKTMDLRTAGDRISIELTRSRRYHRPLSLLVVHIDHLPDKKSSGGENALQGDILARFAVARIGQVINDRTRETDLILRDSNSRFIIICPETGYSYATQLAERISKTIVESIGAKVQWGAASFPDEALTFEALVQKAMEGLTTIQVATIPENVEHKSFQ